MLSDIIQMPLLVLSLGTFDGVQEDHEWLLPLFRTPQPIVVSCLRDAREYASVLYRLSILYRALERCEDVRG